ncbi:MAG: hypothetical protein GX299_10475 [Epulopiscium sp.]|nr:hypothetical protein [Candidatus Epulonipiscium sp.]
MKSMEAFFKSEDCLPKNKKIFVSDRFVDQNEQVLLWEIAAITEEKNAMVRQESASQMEYYAKLCVECVVFPDLKDKKLWQSYDASKPEDALRKMLYMGEYMTLIQEIRSLNGFEKRAFALKEKAKN